MCSWLVCIMLFILDFKAFTDIFYFHGDAFASCCWQKRRVRIVGWRCWTSGCVAFVVLLCACMGGKCGRKQLSYGSLNTSLKVFWWLRILLPRRPVPERNAGDDRIPCAMEWFPLLCAYRQLVRIFWLILLAPDFLTRAYAYNCVWSLAFSPSPFTHVPMSVSVLHEDGMTDVPFEKNIFGYVVWVRVKSIA